MCSELQRTLPAEYLGVALSSTWVVFVCLCRRSERSHLQQVPYINQGRNEQGRLERITCVKLI